MADRIKGITVEIGGDITGLNKALSGVNKEIKTTKSQLKDVERLLKLDPKNTQLLEQKQRLLADAVGETKDKLEALKTAEKQVQDQFAKGEISQQQYDSLQREIVDTEQKLKGLEKQVEDSSHSLDDLEKQAEDSSQALGKMSDGAKRVSDAAGKVSKATAPITRGIRNLGVAAVATVPATEELRTALSRLDTNAKQTGAGVDSARQAFSDLYVVSGELDSSVEAVSNLLQSDFTGSNLQAAVEGVSNAAIAFPDTIKIESLADSLQETLATGSATGQFAEMLDRMGIGAENFSNDLAKCKTEAEKQSVVLAALNGGPLSGYYEAWKETNPEIVQARESSLQLQQSMADLAISIQPLLSKVAEIAKAFLDWFNGLSDGGKEVVVAIAVVLAAISPVAGAIGGVAEVAGKMSGVIGTISSKVLPALSSAFSFLAANPIVLVIAVIAALVAGLVHLWNTNENFRNAILNAWEAIKNGIGSAIEAVKNWFGGFVTAASQTFETIKSGITGFVQGVLQWFGNLYNGIATTLGNAKTAFFNLLSYVTGTFVNAWSQAWGTVKSVFSNIFGALVGIAKAPINGIIRLLNGAINAINRLIGGFNKLGFDMPKWLGGGSWHPNIPKIPNIAYLAKGGTLLKGNAIVGEAGPELLSMVNGKARVQPLRHGEKALAGGVAEMRHTFDVLHVEGVNDRGQLVATADFAVEEMLTDILRRQARV